MDNQNKIVGRIVAPILILLCVLTMFLPIMKVEDVAADLFSGIDGFEYYADGDNGIYDIDDVEDMFESELRYEMEKFDIQLEDEEKAVESEVNLFRVLSDGKVTPVEVMYGFEFAKTLEEMYGDSDDGYIATILCGVLVYCKFIIVIFVLVCLLGIFFIARGGYRGGIAPFVLSIVWAIHWAILDFLVTIGLTDTVPNPNAFTCWIVVPFILTLVAMILSIKNNKPQKAYNQPNYSVPVGASPNQNAYGSQGGYNGPVYGTQPVTESQQKNVSADFYNTQGAMKFCPQCGAKVLVDSKFCEFCGKPLN